MPDTKQKQTAAGRDARAVAYAKLDLIGANLPSAAIHVLVGSIGLTIALDGSITGFGHELTVWQAVWLAAQLVIAAAFFAVRRMWPAGVGAGFLGIRRHTIYIALYLVSGASWGVLTWIALVPGDVINQVFMILVVMAISAIYIVRLSAYTPVFFAGTFGLFAVALPNSWMEANGLATLVAIAAPAWLVLLSASGWRLGQQIGEMIEARMRETDMAARLTLAHARAEQESASKSAFLANMSHELRTPLNAIIGFSDVMRTGLFGALNARYDGYVRDIHASGEHLLSLINDVLDIAKIEAGRMEITVELIDPREAVMQAVRLLQPRADEKRQTLTARLTAAPAAMHVDPRAFRQILLNLAGNAVKFTQAGGTVEIEVLASRGDVVLRVSDNGPGISTDRQQRLFRPFERLDNSYVAGDAGTGLGLALVRSLAALHGGEAALDSAPGHGTSVTVRLPGAAAPAAAAA